MGDDRIASMMTISLQAQSSNHGEQTRIAGCCPSAIEPLYVGRVLHDLNSLRANQFARLPRRFRNRG